MPRAALTELIDNHFTDARAVGAPTKVTTGNYNWIDSLESQLVAVDAAYYTEERLDNMTINDMVFALRTHVDSEGFVPSGVTASPGAVFSAPVVVDEDPDTHGHDHGHHGHGHGHGDKPRRKRRGN